MLSKYEEGKLPPHLLAALNILRYARWARWKIDRQKNSINERKRETSVFSRRVQQLRLELDEIKYGDNRGQKESEEV
jgi:hypothetical protein